MGKAVAEMLVDLGAQVYALDIQDCGVNGIRKFINVNLSEKESIDSAFEQLPPSIDRFLGVESVSGLKTDYVTTFNIDYTANMYICEKYLKTRMTEGVAIVIVSSCSGIAWHDYLDECKLFADERTWQGVQEKLKELVLKGTPSQIAYMLSKRVVIAYANELALELGKRKIRVNSVLPGNADTGMKTEFATMAGGIDNMVKDAGLAGRLATSEEMAQPIVFLGSSMASFISGEELVVDYCDNCLKKLGLKQNLCSGKALLTKEELQYTIEMMKANHS